MGKLSLCVILPQLLVGNAHELEALLEILGRHALEALLEETLMEALHDIVDEVAAFDGAERHVDAIGTSAVRDEPPVRT